MPKEQEMHPLALSHKLQMKKLAVMQDIEGLVKDGKAPEKMGGFKFVTDEQVESALRVLFIKHELTITIEAKSESIQNFPAYSGKQMSILIPMVVTLHDATTGYAEESEWLGMGSDAAEKSLYKAFTGGIKYWLLKTFLVPTRDDPEGTGQQQHQQPPDQQQPPPGQQQPQEQQPQQQQPPPGQQQPQEQQRQQWPDMSDEQRSNMLKVQGYYEGQETPHLTLNKHKLCNAVFKNLGRWPATKSDITIIKQYVKAIDVMDKMP